MHGARRGLFRECARVNRMKKNLTSLLARVMGGSKQADQPATDFDRLVWVRAAYLSLLGREPDMQGQLHWLEFLRKGGSYEKLLQDFALSRECRRRIDVLKEQPLPVPHQQDRPKVPSRIVVVGNCQVDPMARCLQAYLGGAIPTRRWVTVDMLVGSEAARADLAKMFDTYEWVLMQPDMWQAASKLHPEAKHKVVLFPSIGFFSFHPDLVYVDWLSEKRFFKGPCGDYNSALALLGWKCDLSVDQTLSLFRGDIYQRLGFFDWGAASHKILLEEGERAGMPLDDALREWNRQGCFMHSINHPKLFVIADIARRVVTKMGLRCLPGDPAQFVTDVLAQSYVWPVYPEVGQRIGMADGSYSFKLEEPGMVSGAPVRTLDLREFVTQSFAAYSGHAKDDLFCARMETDAFRDLAEELRTGFASPIAMPLHAPLEAVSPSPVRTVVKAHRFAVLGNCQSGHMARCLQALVGGSMPTQDWLFPDRLADIESGRSDMTSVFTDHDYVFIQPAIWELMAPLYRQYQDKVVLYPSINFFAYQPDLMTITMKASGKAFEEGPTGRCHSSLAFLGWQAGIGVEETVALFNAEIYQRLSFFDWWSTSVRLLLEEGLKANLPLDDLFAQWSAPGCFMYCHVHPRLTVIADIARVLLRRLGIPMQQARAVDFANDYLANGVVWPVYPEIAAKLGCAGDYLFKRSAPAYQPDHPVHMVDLQRFVEESYAAYSKYQPEDFDCMRLEQPAFQILLKELQQSKGNRAIKPMPASMQASKPLQVPMVLPVETPQSLPTTPTRPEVESASSRIHPYQHLPEHRFWRKAVQGVAVDRVDPVVKAGLRIETSTRVATAGSCFAQHISRRLADGGFHFLRTEGRQDAGSSDDWYSARYGNLYTARQLLQLFDRAYGVFTPVDTAWAMDNGHYADPFRPQVETGGFVSVEALEAARVEHLAAVRRMFETLDVFVFTLGLTETWYAKADAAVFPLAPGVVAGEMDPERYGFINLSAAEVAADLEAFIQRLHTINPGARLIFTVSPVPLAATYADRHVLVSTTYSKAALRVAVEEVIQRHPACEYFPSYEIITGSYNRGRYYGEDLRAVTPEGVDHVMRLFFEHYAGAAPVLSVEEQRQAEVRRSFRIVCDEELLAAAVVR